MLLDKHKKTKLKIETKNQRKGKMFFNLRINRYGDI